MDGKTGGYTGTDHSTCEQHFQNFSNRFAELPVKIAELSRFRSVKEQAQALQDMADGRLDIHHWHAQTHPETM